MLGVLPTSLEINGEEYGIRTDFRVILTIFEAMNDEELTDREKAIVTLSCLYERVPADLNAALSSAIWFINGGKSVNSETQKPAPKLFDWEQDESLIFSAINKVAGCEVRNLAFLHWFTFLGYFNEVGEGLFSTVLNIRSKRARGKKLEKYEQEFYREHKSLVDLRRKRTSEEQSEIDALNGVFR